MKKQWGEKVERRVANIKHWFLKKEIFEVKPVVVVKSFIILTLSGCCLQLICKISWLVVILLNTGYVSRLSPIGEQQQGKRQEEDQIEYLDEVEMLMTDLASFSTTMKEIRPEQVEK